MLVLTTMWCSLGVPALGIAEKQKLLLDDAVAEHPEAELCGDVYSGDWERWSFGKKRAEVLSGGPGCHPYSEAGPQLGGDHKDSAQLLMMGLQQPDSNPGGSSWKM